MIFLPNKPLDTVRAVFYPDRCCFCGKVVIHDTELCPDCRQNEKPVETPKCSACGKSKKDCSCKGKSNFYNGITAPYNYKGNVRNGILRWKYGGAFRSVGFFGKIVAQSVRDDFDYLKTDVITFVPQTKAEARERGENQGEILANEVGKIMNIPVKPLLVKLFETERQHDLPWYMKSGNVFGVFGCPDISAVEGKTILLIDDVKTSGKTLNECAKVLHLNGAAEVYCAVIGVS